MNYYYLDLDHYIILQSTSNNNRQAQISMHKLQNIILKLRVNKLEQAVAFTSVKSFSLEQKLKWLENQLSSSAFIHSFAENNRSNVEICNKSLYLEYVALVLARKEKVLAQWEDNLQRKQIELNQVVFDKEILSKITLLSEAKAIQSKAIDIGYKLASATSKDTTIQQQFKTINDQVLQMCHQFQQKMRKQFKQIYDEIAHERILLKNKISQYAELSAYEKYLNQLHEALQARTQLQSNSSEQYEEKSQTTNQKLNAEVSSKKRHRIFDRKVQNQTNNHRQQHLHFQKNNNESFESDVAPGKIIHNYNQSSQIMRENHIKSNLRSMQNVQNMSNQSQTEYTMQYMQQNKISKINSFSREELHPSHVKNDVENRLENTIDVKEKGVQFSGMSITQKSRQLYTEQKILKFAKLWLKYSMHKNQTSQKKKHFALYLWRTNAIFDDSIPNKFKASLHILQNIWGKKRQLLVSSKMLPYQQLSLKRKKYTELFLEFQIKKHHREQIERLLKSIIRNRNRKQKLTFVYYFVRFYKNTKVKRTQTTADQKNVQSRIISASCSNILQQEKLLSPFSKKDHTPNKKQITPAKKTTPTKLKHSQLTSRSQKILAPQSVSNKSNISKPQKQNSSYYKSSSLQAKQHKQLLKLQQYVKQKERIEKLLATQCVKMEAMIKIVNILSITGFRRHNQFFSLIKQRNFEQRVNNLSKQVTSLEFRMELTLTKCRLGLANNNNKLSTLQNLLGLTNLMK